MPNFDPETLYALSAELRAVADALAERGEASSASHQIVVDPTLLQSIIRARRLRDKFFDKSLFADPAWDMMLELLAARLEGRAVTVSSLCIAASVPPTTALRWIKLLCERQIIERASDPTDGRRSFLKLTDEATAALIRYFDETLGAPPQSV